MMQVDEGRSRAAPVLSADPSEVDRAAAHDPQSYLHRMSGVQMPIAGLEIFRLNCYLLEVSQRAYAEGAGLVFSRRGKDRYLVGQVPPIRQVRRQDHVVSHCWGNEE